MCISSYQKRLFKHFYIRQIVSCMKPLVHMIRTAILQHCNVRTLVFETEVIKEFVGTMTVFHLFWRYRRIRWRSDIGLCMCMCEGQNCKLTSNNVAPSTNYDTLVVITIFWHLRQTYWSYTRSKVNSSDQYQQRDVILIGLSSILRMQDHFSYTMYTIG